MFKVDAKEMREAIRSLGDRITALTDDVSLGELRELHRDVRSLVDLLWVDEVTKFTEQFSRRERAELIDAMDRIATLIDRLPALPEHAS